MIAASKDPIEEPRRQGPTRRYWPLRGHIEQQRAFLCALTGAARFIGIDAGRRSGKTDLAKRWLVVQLPEPKPWPDPKYFYCLPTRDQAKRVAWQDLQDLIPDDWIDGGKLGPNVRQGDLIIRTRFGSELHVLGMDKPARFEGTPWDGGILDEMSDQKPGCFDLHVRPALETMQNEINRRGWCWMIGKPSRQGCGAAWFRDFCERARRGEYPDGAAFTWPSWDVLPADVIQQARQTMAPKDFQEQYGARWETAGGAIFYSFDRAYNVRPCSYDASLPILVGSDFNVDPMAWTLSHRKGSVLETFDEIWLRNTNTRATLDVLAGRYGDHTGGWQFYGDSSWAQARKTSAALTDYAQIHNDERFVAMGRTLHYGSENPPVEDRFAACNALLCNAASERRAFIDPGCKHLVADMEMRSYKTGTREVQDGPDIGHSSDAWGYVVHKLFPIRFQSYGTSEIITTGGRR